MDAIKTPETAKYEEISKWASEPELQETHISDMTLLITHIKREVPEDVTKNGMSCKDSVLDVLKLEWNEPKNLKQPKTKPKRRRNNAPVECEKCDFITTKPSYLRSHMQHRHTPKNFEWFLCDHCPYKAKIKSNLKIHKSVHNNTLQDIKCSICGINFDNFNSLKAHVTDKHPLTDLTKWHECEQCCDKFRSVSHLKRHILVHHKSDQEIKWLYCAHCSYKSKDKGYLKNHIFSRHYKHRLVKCTKCDFTTKVKSYLRSHMINKHGKRDFKWLYCDQCSHKAKSEETLNAHLTSVHNLKVHVIQLHKPYKSEKLFDCDQCSNKYKNKSHLNRHVILNHKTGDDVMWFECDKCPYKAKISSYLKEHCKIHLKNK